MGLEQFWIELKPSSGAPGGYGARYGVTAWSVDDAAAILRATVFARSELPEIGSVVDGLDVSTLDADHVLPNLGAPARRGVWYPVGYEADRLPAPPVGRKSLP